MRPFADLAQAIERLADAFNACATEGHGAVRELCVALVIAAAVSAAAPALIARMLKKGD